jgi:HTH-type transcriptional regulator/antitoxin HigA
MEMQMSERIPAEGFLPGDLIKEELEERGWAQEDLAEILGRTNTAVNEIITGKRGITVETAKGLGEAFNTGAQFWLNMESAYRLSLEQTRPETVSRKAFLFGIAPVRAMIKRNWIEASTNIEVLEQRLKEFFQTKDLRQIPVLNYKARKSTEELTSAQKAWLFRAMNLASAVHAEKYTKNKLNVALRKLKELRSDEADIRHIPRLLADAGVKLLIIEPLPKSKIDGVSFWLDGTPVIVLSLRYDRVDYFWYTLMHELGHIKNGDGLRGKYIIVDADLYEENNDSSPYEKAADEFAANFLVPQEELDNFINRIQPMYSKSKILNFANRLNVHPGIVVGQLHHRGVEQGGLDYSHYREMLIKIRHIITRVAITDGYGQIISVNLS